MISMKPLDSLEQVQTYMHSFNAPSKEFVGGQKDPLGKSAP